jgi:low temperature requirement protein LtrA
MIHAWSLTRTAASADRVTRLELFFDLVFVFALSRLSHHLMEHPSIDAAFGAFGWLFAASYLLIQLGRCARMLTVGLDPTTHVVRTLIWQCMSAPFWIAGVFFGPELRLLLGAAAATIDLLGHMLAHRLLGRKTEGSQVPLPGERIFERFGLFYLIALGETILATGQAIADNLADPLILVTGTVGLAGNALVVLLAGLILVAVGDRLVISNPTARPDLETVLFLYGGPLLFLAGRGVFVRHVLGYRREPRPNETGTVVTAYWHPVPGNGHARFHRQRR